MLQRVRTSLERRRGHEPGIALPFRCRHNWTTLHMKEQASFKLIEVSKRHALSDDKPIVVAKSGPGTHDLSETLSTDILVGSSNSLS